MRFVLTEIRRRQKNEFEQEWSFLSNLHMKNTGNSNRIGNAGQTIIDQIKIIVIFQIDAERS